MAASFVQHKHFKGEQNLLIRVWSKVHKSICKEPTVAWRLLLQFNLDRIIFLARRDECPESYH